METQKQLRNRPSIYNEVIGGWMRVDAKWHVLRGQNERSINISLFGRDH